MNNHLVILSVASGCLAVLSPVRADLVPPKTPPPQSIPATEIRAAPPIPERAPSGSVGAANSAVPRSGTESPPTLQAADLLGPDWVSGPAHRVRAAVPTDGYMAHFTIDSDFGTFQCAGVDRARQRILEIGAISKLVAESKGDVFAEALKKSIEQPVEAVKNIVKNPEGTLERAPETVGHFFRRLGSTIKAGAEQVAERVAEDIRDDEGNSPRPSSTRTGENIATAGRGLIGFEKAKLECARQLGVDPYSDNPVLQEQLEKIAWVYFAGGLPLRVGAAAASGGVSLALTSTTMIGLPEEVYALTPSELALRHRESLSRLHVPEEVQSEFMDNRVLSPTLRLTILQSLDRLAPATGRPALVELAARCQTAEQAQFLDRSLRLLADRQHLGLARYTRVAALGRVPAAIEADGGVHVAAVVDYVSWTNEVADFAHRDDLRAQNPTLILTGQATESAIAGFKEAGWKLARP